MEPKTSKVKLYRSSKSNNPIPREIEKKTKAKGENTQLENWNNADSKSV